MEQSARVKVAIVGARLGVNPWALRRWIYGCKVPHIKTDTGRVFRPSENKAALASQLDGLRPYDTARGYQIVHVVTEVASGMNDKRPPLRVLLKHNDFDVLLVEHTERLTRFGFAWFEALCSCTIEIINLAAHDTSDLMVEDLVTVLTSFAGRVYGQWWGRQKTAAAIKALQETTS